MQYLFRGSVLTLLAMAGLPFDAFGQTASQITPPTFQPQTISKGGFIIPDVAGLATPAGAENLHVRLSGLGVTGGLPELAAVSANLEARLIGRDITGAELFAAARELEAAYVVAGFVLVRVVLPPQRLVNGSRLKLSVIDGFIERVETKDLPERVRGRIASLLEPLVGRRGLKLSEIERRVLFASDTPGVLFRSTLAPGREEGGTLLLIEAKHQAIMGSLNADNSLSKALGRTAPGIGVDLNSVAGRGEQVYLRAGGVSNFSSDGFFARYPLNRSLAAGFSLPLGLDGLSFNTEYTDARTTPLAASGFRTTDNFGRLALRVRYAWVRARNMNFNSEVSLDVEDDLLRLFVAGVPTGLSLDRLRVLRLVNDGNILTSWGGSLSGKLTLSQGLDTLGARSLSDASALLPLSRQGATAAFQKAEILLGYGQTLAEHLAANLLLRAQTSFNQPLLHAEQFGIANTSGVSAFDSGAVTGDSGYVVRGELSSPWHIPYPTIKVSVTASPYVFSSFGAVWLTNPTALEKSSTRATSTGLGLRFNGTTSGTLGNASLNLEYGRSTRSDGGEAGNRFTIAATTKF
jgi:hemolysin activation/secretion protein